MNVLKPLSISISLLVCACTTTPTVVYKPELICMSIPKHTDAQQDLLYQELLPLNNDAVIITYIGEYLKLRNQIDECNKNSTSSVTTTTTKQ